MFVKSVLPKMRDDQVHKLLEALSEDGFTDIEELAQLTEEDLRGYKTMHNISGLGKPVIRKLLRSIAEKNGANTPQTKKSSPVESEDWQAEEIDFDRLMAKSEA